MNSLKRMLFGGLAAIVLATNIGCTTLNSNPIEKESIKSNKNNYTIEKVNGLKVPFTKDTKIFYGLDAISYNGPLFYFNGDSFKENSSYLADKHQKLINDENTKDNLHVLYPIGENSNGQKVYETYIVDKDKFDKELEKDSVFYETLKEQGAYVSRNFNPEKVNELDENINPISIYYIYYNPSSKKDKSSSNKPNYDIPTYIPGDSGSVGGGEYNPGSGGSIGN